MLFLWFNEIQKEWSHKSLVQRYMCICNKTFLPTTGTIFDDRKMSTFRNYIKPDSTLIHDEESAHNKMIKELSLNSVAYSSSDLKGLSDKENPLNPVNRNHDILKKFLYAHSSFIRNDMQGCLNLIPFITNLPFDMLEKVEHMIKLTFQNSKLLRYGDFYGVNTDL